MQSLYKKRIVDYTDSSGNYACGWENAVCQNDNQMKTDGPTFHRPGSPIFLIYVRKDVMGKKVTIVLATRNKGKTEEIRDLLKQFPVDLVNLDDFGPIPPVIEDGATFDENAYKKASFTARVLGIPAIADDSGLVVDALGGAPGVYSARYAGENATDLANLEKLLVEMKGKTDRKAAFECVISLAVPTGAALTYEGRCEGTITETPSGTHGFGYDPVFFHSETHKTFAELNLDEKARISHRGKAMKEMAREFDKVLLWIEQNMPVMTKQGCMSGSHDGI